MNLDNHWKKALNQTRRKPRLNSTEVSDNRTAGEVDYDRILFSTPVRRLADKTQVFPLERNDSVRTRLTHSHEVSNLARSIGMGLVHQAQIAEGVKDARRNIPAMLAAVGLAHDLGNPPFGHQGEEAIQQWFKRNQVVHFEGLADLLMNDFLKFEGNAQTLRVVTRLQLLDHEYGLDLTVGTLAALMKYSADSSSSSKKLSYCARRKPGFFQSEKNIAEKIFSDVGIPIGRRHPLAYIMEACDDIAYSVLDVEDAVKKSIFSFHDVIGFLQKENENLKDEVIARVCKKAEDKSKEYNEKGPKLSPAELGDISMQRFRAAAIMEMVNAVHDAFIKYQPEIVEGELKESLLDVSRAGLLAANLKDLALSRAYNHRSVLEIELRGYNILQELMDMLWYGITQRESLDELGSKRKTPFAKFVYGRISENYRRVFLEKQEGVSNRYKEAQLLTDMIAGMTDTFALDLHAELKSYQDRDFKAYLNGT